MACSGVGGVTEDGGDRGHFGVRVAGCVGSSVAGSGPLGSVVVVVFDRVNCVKGVAARRGSVDDV